jgi:hypothetical protein
MPFHFQTDVVKPLPQVKPSGCVDPETESTIADIDQFSRYALKKQPDIL